MTRDNVAVGILIGGILASGFAVGWLLSMLLDALR